MSEVNNEVKKITEVPSSTPVKILGIGANGMCKTSVSNLFALNPMEAKYNVKASPDKWMRVASAETINGGSGLIYIYRDWGTGGPLYALIGFCLMHGNSGYSDSYKPQVVYAFGNTGGVRVRVVRSFSPRLYHIDVMSTNPADVVMKVNLMTHFGCKDGALAAPILNADDEIYEYSISDL